MRILGISGSLRRGSHNRRLLRAAGDALPPGVELVEWDGLAGLPAFDEDLETTPPEPVREFLDAIEDADALLIATPGVQRLAPGRAQERARLGLAPVPRQRPAATSRPPSSARAPACSAPSGRRPRCARCSRPPARTCSSPSCRSAWPTARSTHDGALADPELSARLGDVVSAISSERWPRRSSNRHDRSRGRPSRPRPRPDPQGARRRGAQPQADPRGRGRARRASAASSAVSMDDVARAACVGTGTLYRRFGDRAGLALALLDEHTRAFQDALIAGPPPLGPGAPGGASGCTRSATATSTCSSATPTSSPRRSRPRAGRRGPSSSTRRTSRSCCARRRRTSTPSSRRARCSRCCTRRTTSTRAARSSWPLERLRAGWHAFVDALTA